MLGGWGGGGVLGGRGVGGVLGGWGVGGVLGGRGVGGVGWRWCVKVGLEEGSSLT